MHPAEWVLWSDSDSSVPSSPTYLSPHFLLIQTILLLLLTVSEVFQAAGARDTPVEIHKEHPDETQSCLLRTGSCWESEQLAAASGRDSMAAEGQQGFVEDKSGSWRRASLQGASDMIG